MKLSHLNLILFFHLTFRRSNLQHVSDIFVMGGCLVLESLVLFHFCERNGFGPLGVSGLSMGGHMASLAATNWPKPLVLVPCLSWSTAAAVFTQGVMSESINWCELESQFFSSSVFRKKLAKMVNVVDGLDEAFMAGKHFVKNYDNTNANLDNDLKRIANNINFSSSDETIDSQPQMIQSGPNRITEIYRKIEELSREMTDSEQSLDDDFSAEEMAKLKSEPIDTTKIKWWEREALQFMRGMMDECTHLKNFSIPYDTSLITAVCAKDDAYVPREGCSSLEDIWPGSEGFSNNHFFLFLCTFFWPFFDHFRSNVYLRLLFIFISVKYVDAGHVSAYVLYQKLIR